MGQCNRCERPTQSGLCQECRLEEYYGVPSDHWDDEKDQPKDPELRSDGGEPMERVTVRVPDEQLAAIDDLVESSDYANRSAAVRAGLQSLIGDDSDDDREIRADGFGTLVDRDGDPIESRPDLAGEHRDTSREWDDGSRIDGHKLRTKWPEIRQAIIEGDGELVTAAEIAADAGSTSDTVRKWLQECERRDLAVCVVEVRPGQSPVYRVDDPGALPEVLLD